MVAKVPPLGAGCIGAPKHNQLRIAEPGCEEWVDDPPTGSSGLVVDDVPVGDETLDREARGATLREAEARLGLAAAER
jgi:hypothetical protein